MTARAAYDGGAGCYGKIRFACWTDARRVLKRHAHRVKRHHTKRRDIYRCPVCRGFHLGGQFG